MQAPREFALNEEEYELFQRLQEQYNQRAMGLGGGGDNLISKVIFNGKNAEAFLSKFPHICTAHQVYNIFYEDYGLQRPGPGNDRRDWDNLDSKAYRVLERHLSEEIWSTIRDRPGMSARQLFTILTETHLTGTVRSISTIELEMENTRMKDSDTLTSHFSNMCRYFRELAMHDQELTDRQKITKTMCKMSLDWYKLTNSWVVTQPDNLTFDQFRRRVIQMDIDGRSFQRESSNHAAFAAKFEAVGTNQQANFHHSVGGRGNRQGNDSQGHRGRGSRGRTTGRGRQQGRQQQQQQDQRTQQGAQLQGDRGCFYCGKVGHIKRDCYAMQRDREQRSKNQPNNQSARIAGEVNISEGCWMANGLDIALMARGLPLKIPYAWMKLLHLT